MNGNIRQTISVFAFLKHSNVADLAGVMAAVEAVVPELDAVSNNVPVPVTSNIFAAIVLVALNIMNLVESPVLGRNEDMPEVVDAGNVTEIAPTVGVINIVPKPRSDGARVIDAPVVVDRTPPFVTVPAQVGNVYASPQFVPILVPVIP